MINLLVRGSAHIPVSDSDVSPRYNVRYFPRRLQGPQLPAASHVMYRKSKVES
jgi:hypothetical protein